MIDQGVLSAIILVLAVAVLLTLLSLRKVADILEIHSDRIKELRDNLLLLAQELRNRED